MSLWNKIKCFFSPSSFETVRARTKKGRFVADDPNTAKNEAYVKKSKKKKVRKKKK
jgi:hypothetical protein|tara:strand:+ start:487 stop:654 length:168 start_codon:yes stop_codon:yes gene_type:complete